MTEVARRAGERIIVALDVPGAEAARGLVRSLRGHVGAFKIGHELAFGGGGLQLAQELVSEGTSVFLDMKLLDIPNTVEKAVAGIARLGVTFLTVHVTDRKTLAAAVRGRGASGLKLLGVTVLTSAEAGDLVEQGIPNVAPRDLVLHRARMARGEGFDGVIASGQEAGLIRAATGAGFLIVTPGIRPAGANAGDQARAATPAAAIAAGADYLVIGRPIVEAKDPAAAAEAITQEIAAAQR